MTLDKGRPSQRKEASYEEKRGKASRRRRLTELAGKGRGTRSFRSSKSSVTKGCKCQVVRGVKKAAEMCIRIQPRKEMKFAW